MPRLKHLVPALLLAACCASRSAADAIVVVRAMKASTIAEIFIEKSSVRVELEIGVSDLEAFRNVMPDEIYERLGHDPAPLADRLPGFFSGDLVVRADDGDPLVADVRQIVPRRRTIRDEITGEPLPAGAGEGEPVIFVEIVYSLRGLPRRVSFAAPRSPDREIVAANIGFVAYHEGLPVNDFRYLGQEETLDLDWDDPWYSRFRNRNLWRRYDAPLSGFLYVDQFEVRKEIVARPKDLQQWIDLGLEGKDTIPVERQEELKGRVAEFLLGRNPVTIDGRTVEPVLDRIHFIRRSLTQTGIIDPPEALPVISATLGVIFVYPVDELPQEVSMTWELFSDRIRQVPAVATDEAGGLPGTVSPEDPVLVWKNFLTKPTRPAFVEIAPPPATTKFPLPVPSAICLVGFVVTMSAFIRRPSFRSNRALVGGGLLLVGAVALLPFGRIEVPNTLSGTPAVSNEQAQAVVAGLLRNVYRAFDYRDEGVIYDTLARSASGDLLSVIYLETRRALELRNQGGARAKVETVEMVESSATPLEEGVGFVARCTWNVTGSVGHWGHIHRRRNQYVAELTVQPVDGVWKMTGLTLLGEQRL